LSCVKSCKANAIIKNENYTCLKIDEVTPISIDADKCIDCGVCRSVCPMGDIEKSGMDCIFCIVCSGRPHCILESDGRTWIRALVALFDILRLKLGI